MRNAQEVFVFLAIVSENNNQECRVGILTN